MKGRARLLDFGIAHRLPGSDGAQTALTREGAFALTPQYAAPEQASEAVALSTATDVYALGVVLHELLTGVHPSGLYGAGALAYMRAATDGAEDGACLRVPAITAGNGVLLQGVNFFSTDDGAQDRHRAPVRRLRRRRP